MPFLDMTTELSGLLPGLSPLLADKFINYAWKDVRQSKNWGFLQADGALSCPTQITAGSATYVQFSQAVVMNAAASAALLAAPSNPGLTNCQIRFGGQTGTQYTGQLYWIVDVDATVPAALVLTLNRIIMEPTTAQAGYQVYRAYVAPPADFLGWQALTDMQNGWTLKLNASSIAFNQRDPQRQAQGLSYYIGTYRGNQINQANDGFSPDVNESAGQPLYELWPHPTSGQTFWVEYRRLGEDFVSPQDALPAIVPEQLIIQRALAFYAYPFAQANKANFPGFKGVNFLELAATSLKLYGSILNDTMRNDGEQAQQSVFHGGHGLRGGSGGGAGRNFPYPIDANFLQSHLINF